MPTSLLVWLLIGLHFGRYLLSAGGAWLFSQLHTHVAINALQDVKTL